MSAWYFHDGVWSEENPKLLGPADHAFWMASVVFDGARAFGGLAPDLDRHCERLIASARALALQPTLTAREIEDLCVAGIRRFPRSAELYVRPMFYAEAGFIRPDPASTRFCLAVQEVPMPSGAGFSACLSPFRRPAPDQAPTDAKASCLYPNSARALREAIGRGFDSCILCDHEGNVAELATANLWLAKDGVAVTPRPNGTFLAGVTRHRVMALLREAGVPVEERTVTVGDLHQADEIFSTGNYGKVQPVTRFETRDLQPGPIYRRARELYFRFAESCRVA